MLLKVLLIIVELVAVAIVLTGNKGPPCELGPEVLLALLVVNITFPEVGIGC